MSDSYISASAFNRYALKGTVKDKAYVDISLAFNPSPVTKDLTILTNERAINNALKNIIMTLPSEVTFFRDFGSRTNLYLFDMIDESTASLLEDEIKRAILFNEPRVSFDMPSTESDLDYGFDNSTAYGVNDNKFVTKGNFTKDFETDELGVRVKASPDQNAYDVTVRYLITGNMKIFFLEMLLTPTR